MFNYPNWACPSTTQLHATPIAAHHATAEVFVRPGTTADKLAAMHAAWFGTCADTISRSPHAAELLDAKHRLSADTAAELLIEALGAEALLLGRRSDEWFAARWASRSGEWADRLNSLPKYVVSSTLEKPMRLVSARTVGDSLVFLTYQRVRDA
jgi:hypothetical protein